jgi:cyclophilin family peptidyl-prolyl cis-trans isomerase
LPVVWLLLALAWAGDGLSLQAIAEAEWRRDVEALLAGPYDDGTLADVARALGRCRDARARPRLELLARQSEPEVRDAAVFALGATPGSAPPLRALLAELDVAEARAAVWRALGRQGDASDLPTMVAALSAPAPEGAGAAKAIGLLARRGIDVSAAVPALVAASGRPDRGVADLAAWALSRVPSPGITAGEAAALRRTWSRSPREEVRAWLAAVIVDALPDGERTAFVHEVLAGPWSAAKVAVLSSARPAWTLGDLEAWATSTDPWVRLRVVQLGAGGVDEARAAVAAGTADAAARSGLVAVAAGGEGTARARSSAAVAVLVRSSDAELATLLAAEDAAIRELAAEAAASRPGMSPVLAAALAREAEDPVRAALLAALAARVASGEALPEEARACARGLVRDGAFGVRAPAAALLRAVGEPSVAAPVTPVPAAGVTLAAARELLGARVVTTAGEVRLALEPEVAPLAVATFAAFAEADAFDGLPWHRVVPGFVVQTGDPRGDGMGGPGWFLPDEPSDAPFVAGAVGIATSGPDTGGSQWFVVVTDQPHLAGSYTRFGRVTGGLGVARRLGPEDRVLDVVVERRTR